MYALRQRNQDNSSSSFISTLSLFFCRFDYFAYCLLYFAYDALDNT